MRPRPLAFYCYHRKVFHSLHTLISNYLMMSELPGGGDIAVTWAWWYCCYLGVVILLLPGGGDIAVTWGWWYCCYLGVVILLLPGGGDIGVTLGWWYCCYLGVVILLLPGGGDIAELWCLSTRDCCWRCWAMNSAALVWGGLQLEGLPPQLPPLAVPVHQSLKCINVHVPYMSFVV